MAGELILSNGMTIKSGTDPIESLTLTTKKHDQVAPGSQGSQFIVLDGVVTTIPVDLLTTAGRYGIIHVSGAGTLRIGGDDGGGFEFNSEIKVGEPDSGRVPTGVVLKVQANGSDVRLSYLVAED